MNRRTTLARRVDMLMHDASTLAALIDPALVALDVAATGWPTSTPGADPRATVTPSGIRFDEDGNPISDTYTATESAALHRDPASADLKAMDKAIKAAAVQLRVAAILARNWAGPTYDASTLERRIAAIDAGIWCENCSRHGHKNVRRPDGKACEYCAGFNSDWKQMPPKDILDLRSAKGRIYEADIRRILGRLRDDRKKTA